MSDLLVVPLRSRMDKRAGLKFEVFAPEGRRFVCGLHSYVCADDAEVADVRTIETEVCPADCDCKD